MNEEYQGENDLYLPPQNIDAEMSVLGSMMLDTRAIDEVTQILKAEHFYKDAHCRIFSAISSMRTEGQPVDVVALAEQLTIKQQLADIGGPEYLVKIMETVPHAAHATHYAEIVRDKATRRDVMKAGRSMTGDAVDGGVDTDTILSRAESNLHGIIEGRLNGESASDLKSLLMDAFEQIQAGKSHGMQIGYTDLDRLLLGWHPGNLLILASRPSVGKTALAINLATRFSRNEENHGVLFVSLEQSRLEVTERILSMESEVPSHLIRNRDVTDEQRDQLMRTSTEISTLPIFIDEDPQRTVTQIAAATRLKCRRDNVRLLIVDYLQLIRPDDKKVHREQQVAEITRSLKLLARQLEIPVIALAQLNRNIELRTNKRPMMSDLRESGAIEQDSDIIMFLDRPSTWDESAHPGEAKLYIAKHRNGQTGTIDFVWDAATMRFLDAAPAYKSRMGDDF